MNAFKEWMGATTGAQKIRLAFLAKTNYRYLYELLRSEKSCGSELAERIEKASVRMSLERLERGASSLPVLSREDLSPVCARCPYALKCKGE